MLLWCGSDLEVSLLCSPFFFGREMAVSVNIILDSEPEETLAAGREKSEMEEPAVEVSPFSALLGTNGFGWNPCFIQSAYLGHAWCDRVVFGTIRQIE